MTIGAVVKNDFRHPDDAARVLNLVKIYQLLKGKHVRNVDVLHEHSTRPPFILVTPVAMDQIPRSSFEAFSAVVCAIQGVLHPFSMVILMAPRSCTQGPLYNLDV
jgi:hypothetical protein